MKSAKDAAAGYLGYMKILAIFLSTLSQLTCSHGKVWVVYTQFPGLFHFGEKNTLPPNL